MVEFDKVDSLATAHLWPSPIYLSLGDFSLSPVLLHPHCHRMVGFLQQTGLSIVLLKKHLSRVSSADFWTKHRVQSTKGSNPSKHSQSTEGDKCISYQY